MSSLVYSAIGTANLGFKPLDFKAASLDPKTADKVGGWFISTNDPALTPEQKKADEANPAAADVRAKLLQEMGLTENDIQSLSDVSKNTLSDDIEKVVYERLAAMGKSQGAYIDIQA